MIPSKYQRAVFTSFDALEPGQTIQINAVAGSGKTSTLMMLLGMQPERVLRETLVCAFNKEIATNISERVPQGVTVKTIHALGMNAITKRFGRATKVDSKKYRHLVNLWWDANVQPKPDDSRDEIDDAKNALYKLAHFTRVTLTDPTDRAAVLRMAIAYDVDTPMPDTILTALPQVIAWGREGVTPRPPNAPDYSPAAMIDFDDMIYLPHALGIKPEGFGVVLVDECQDLSRAQLKLVLSACRPGGRKVFVGDPKQAIYAFAGADNASFENIQTRTGALELPLSICYRCPTEVVRVAKALVPQIEPAPDAPAGLVEVVTDKFFTENVTPRDMILCRVTAPLIETAFWLIRNGKKAKVKGRDVGAQLVKVIDAVEKLKGYDWETFDAALARWREIELKVIENRGDAEAMRISIEDRHDSVLAVRHGALRAGAASFGDLRAHIQDLFTDDGTGIILLSTIHRAKGLEAETVFVLSPEKIPHPMARSAAALEQEANLLYVAITRAMRRLYVVSTPDRDVPEFWAGHAATVAPSSAALFPELEGRS